MSQILIFASGKGGVGKSTLTANLGALLACNHHAVALVDADIGLRSQDAILGMENRVVYDLIDVSEGKVPLSSALLEVPDLPDLKLLPASQFARARDLEVKPFRKVLEFLRRDYEYILVDCPAGLERGLRNVLNAGADETVLVATPDDLCLRDAERVASLVEEKGLPRPRLLVNRLKNDLVAAGDMYSAETCAATLDLALLGEIPEDEAFSLAQLRHDLVIDYRCEARQALLRIASRLAGSEVAFPAYGREKTSFFRKHFPPQIVKEPLRDFWRQQSEAQKPAE